MHGHPARLTGGCDDGEAAGRDAAGRGRRQRWASLRRLAALVVLSTAACAGPWQTGASDIEDAGPEGGVSLQAQTRRQADGSIRVQYQVENAGADPVVVTDGVPAQDTTKLPEVDPDAAYVRLRAGGIVEVSRRTFTPAGQTERDGSALMLGTLLPPGQSLSGTVRLEPPVALYRPYAATSDDQVLPDGPLRVVFCLGVVDLLDVDPALQGQVGEQQRVLRHPTRQLLLCSPEAVLP